MEGENTNEVIIDVYSWVNHETEETKELLQVYLENRRLTDGGNIRRVEQSSNNKSQFTVDFEESSVRQRLLDRKFLSFNSFLIRSSTRGYRLDEYETNRREILLRGCESIDLASNADDHEIMRMYAENLLPDSDVHDIRKSSIFPDVIIIEYTTDYDSEALETRFAKRPRIKSINVRLLKSFKTNTILIKSANLDPSKIREIINKQSPRVPKYFMDVNEAHNYLLLQFEPDFPLSQELIESIRALDSISQVEFCANFELVNDLDSQEPVKKPTLSSNLDHKSVQTELKSSDIEKLQAPKDSVQINLAQMKLNPSPVASQVVSPNNKTTPVVNKVNKNSLTLDQGKAYSIAMINSKQLFILFRDLLKKKYPEIEVTRDVDNRVILAENKKKGSDS